MKHKKQSALTAFVLVILLMVSGCAGSKSPLEGDWAYNHDPETVILSLKGDKAVFKGAEYAAAWSDEFLLLTADNGGTVTLRYERNKEGVLLYEPTDYVYDGEGEPEGLVGLWKDAADNWSFEFTENGTFKEDGYFPGLYSMQADGTVKLVYNDMFPDTVLYYTIDGDTLRIEYPWQMVSAG